MRKLILTFILAAVVGVIGGLQGNAGSVYILTGLMAFGIIKSQRKAAGTTLLFTALPVTLGGAYQYYKKGDVDIKTALILTVVAFIFSIFGSKLNYLISPQITEYSIAVTMGICSLYYFYIAYQMK